MDQTDFFDRIITTIREKTRPPKDDDVSSAMLCYWLSNTVTLFLLLHTNLKPVETPPGVCRLTAGSVSPASASSSPLTLSKCTAIWFSCECR
jgi:hypothetical protein